MRRLKSRYALLEVLVALLAVLFLLPFYLVVSNSFKANGDILSGMMALPGSLRLENYANAWELLNFPTVLTNSVLITVLSNIGTTLFAAMAAHQFIRRKHWINNYLFALFVASMVIPFHTLMIPLVQVLKSMGLTNSIAGVVIAYWGLSISFAIFLFHGFIKSLPLEIEEAALIDGCTPYSLFARIVMPLLRPITATVIMVHTLWYWNDFLLPLLLLQRPDLRTIPVAINSMFGQYMKNWELALPALTMAIAPAALLFLVLQRQVMEGVTNGAVKG
ncbi:carbohydrate ABC transporter permease [Paenibacillus sp. S150]|uniref:carbohydrate ABC transporter permease n=1 Tax=Paenibacillus sp. S150 TaxID=2749826 RepID=UPI001C583CF3|nr:carbohydrate ABC transporter permease [Paenibacillus sp. S150]MBW4081189.1 carbohydrate ABC transporter permease [Paenibacillus sp. S150]